MPLKCVFPHRSKILTTRRIRCSMQYAKQVLENLALSTHPHPHPHTHTKFYLVCITKHKNNDVNYQQRCNNFFFY